MTWPIHGGLLARLMNPPKIALVSLIASGRLGIGRVGVAAGFLLASLPGTVFAASAPASPYRGLWVGQVTVSYVNEVPVPLDENNVPIAPDPKVATPTPSPARLRLILHVDGAQQVNLLRDVAVLARTSSTGSSAVDLKTNPGALENQGSLLTRESDMVLVTDERLYGEFPAQPALRIASAVFDFGEDRATKAVQALIDAAAKGARLAVRAKPGDVAYAEQSASMNATSNVLARSNVADEFARFLAEDFNKPQVNTVAEDLAGGDTATLEAAQMAADLTAQWSPFFGDQRASNMVRAVGIAATTAAAEEPDTAKKVASAQKAAQNTAAAYADLTGEYARFLAGGPFGKMISDAAIEAGTAAVVPGATAALIAQRVNGHPTVRLNRTEAVTLASLSDYTDSRAPDAVSLVVDAIVAAAAAMLPADPGTEAAVTAAAEMAGRDALANDVRRYPVPPIGPSPDYDTFVESDEFEGSVAIVAKAAAERVVEALAEDPFLTDAEVEQAAADAATDALRLADQDPVRVGLQNAFVSAAHAARRELPLTGEGFGAGKGDPRYSYVIKRDGLAPLQAAALEGTVFLPASHPTNPFRHRRHPDHRYGFDVTRQIRLDFDDGPEGSVARAGYGVDRITGVYREEIFGLHKPLGPKKDVGLRVEGRFELNRISHIDALNAPSLNAVP